MFWRPKIYELYGNALSPCVTGEENFFPATAVVSFLHVSSKISDLTAQISL